MTHLSGSCLPTTTYPTVIKDFHPCALLMTPYQVIFSSSFFILTFLLVSDILHTYPFLFLLLFCYCDLHAYFNVRMSTPITSGTLTHRLKYFPFSRAFKSSYFFPCITLFQVSDAFPLPILTELHSQIISMSTTFSS